MGKKKMTRQAKRDMLAGYLFITPLVAGLGVFSFFAFFLNLYISFTDKAGFKAAKWVGLDNYVKLFQDVKFAGAFGNTFRYVLVCVPAILVISILLAVLLNTNIKGRGFYRTFVFFPLVTASAAIAMAWRWMFNTRNGIINIALGELGIKGVPWLTSGDIALYTISIVVIWSSVSYQVIILLAGLQGIPHVYYEAACIDGAGPVRQFFKVTLPLLTPTIYFVMTLLVMNVFKLFDLVYLIMPSSIGGIGSPAQAGSRTVVSLFYTTAFSDSNEGYGSAIAVMLFAVILVITLIQNYFQKKWVFYD